jgi:hypothetical protein
MCCGLQRGPTPHWESRGNREIWPLYHFLRAWRFFFAAFAPSLPSAVRVALDRCATVRFFFATAAAFLMFFLAAAFCAAVIREDRICEPECAFELTEDLRTELRQF